MSFQTILNDDPQINYSKTPPWDPMSPGSTKQQGAKANCTFNGNQGINVKVYGTGTVSPKGNTPSASFFLDTCAPPIYQWSLDTKSLHEQLMYECVITSGGEHFLEIDVTSANNFRMFSLHRIELGGPVNPPEPYGDETATISPPTSSSSPSESPENKNSDVNIGGIVGGVIACLVVLASLLAFILYRKRQLERRRSSRHITPFMASTMSDVPDTPLPTHAAIPSSPPRIHSPPIGRDRSPAILEDELPPPFTAGNSRDIARHGSMYKPRRSVESLPPTEYGYGGGLREWSSENRQSPLR
ncbi:hypothetical protein VNI00_001274 [Paramarasmius palmivorus]|uniref:Uncharacterized protein n=1 Tax=Paramarasmius palmivorus TaxID=297713 RepID=A0AAW0E960_9AGAR